MLGPQLCAAYSLLPASGGDRRRGERSRQGRSTAKHEAEAAQGSPAPGSVEEEGQVVGLQAEGVLMVQKHAPGENEQGVCLASAFLPACLCPPPLLSYHNSGEDKFKMTLL